MERTNPVAFEIVTNAMKTYDTMLKNERHFSNPKLIELRTSFEEILETIETNTLKEKFSVFDSDGDCRISFEEFKHTCRRLEFLINDADAELLFKSFDESGDGFIDFREFKDIVDKNHKLYQSIGDTIEADLYDRDVPIEIIQTIHSSLQDLMRQVKKNVKANQDWLKSCRSTTKDGIVLTNLQRAELNALKHKPLSYLESELNYSYFLRCIAMHHIYKIKQKSERTKWLCDFFKETEIDNDDDKEDLEF